MKHYKGYQTWPSTKTYKKHISFRVNYDTITPSVILRQLFLKKSGLVNTQYTHYQGGDFTGRLESLLTSQTMVADLTGLPYCQCITFVFCYFSTKQQPPFPPRPPPPSSAAAEGDDPCSFNHLK
jgi:hypothetical protein